ncbi:3-hydroxyacyl-CoA dehydrogenase [Mesorhizobium sp. L-8-3]|uniref:3-hydroxyacyl-CoA dehydrogenase n=1 Tax=Mesorhizobium sp. L-8-3 TaxID=2744522 RepID=UPI0019251E3B|nr:3-hydroxyacyl-CoA dehydrogenase [Mesorhizobium sp. L-8-3]BCH20335.1 hypothetical protein MesoLjLb_01200 [Mesorhizobium sp. L-8-3]
MTVSLPEGGISGHAQSDDALVEASVQSRALHHVLVAERGAGMPDRLRHLAAHDLPGIAVVGGGTMGAGIAFALLSAGCSVTVLEADDEGASRAEANLAKLVEVGLGRGFLTSGSVEALRSRLTVTTDYSRASGCGLAIEAAFESMDVKRQVLLALEAALPRDAVLATNTSYLDIDTMAEVLDDPARLVGLHFFAPAHIMKLLEIVQGRKSSDAAVALGFALAGRLRKVPVLAGVCDGFIGNRILARYREAADTLLMDGSTPWDIDEAMVDFGYRMGPYEAQDLSGLDIAHANRRRQDATRDRNRRYIPIADRMVAEGRLGRKAAVGWYRYPGGGGKVIDPLVEDLVREEAYFAKVTRRTFTADDIRHRLLLAMINEAAEILFEGIAASASDIDLVTIHGYGFPRWRGGLMHYAETLGAEEILAALHELAKEDPVVWRPSRMIVDCVGRGVTFAEWRRREAVPSLAPAGQSAPFSGSPGAL